MMLWIALRNNFVNYLYLCLLIHTLSLMGFSLYFHLYLEEWHSDVSRHWPLNQAVASTACERQKRFNGLQRWFHVLTLIVTETTP